MSDQRLRILIDANYPGRQTVQGASRDLDQLGKSTQGADQAQQKWSASSQKVFSVLKGVGIGAIAGAGYAAVQFGRQSIQAASDLEELNSKANTVFAETLPSTTLALEDMADRLQRSESGLLGMATAMQDTFVPMGFARDRAAELSLQMTELAVDLSSFNNMTMDEALDRLQGTLVGAHRNALAFGVVINENVLKQELYRMGAQDLSGDLLEQAKIQARINLLLAGTADAQGDAERTAGSYANQQRALEAVMGDLQETVGEQLLPTLTELTANMVTLVKWTNENYEAITTWTRGIERTRSAITTLGVTELLPVMKDARTETRSAAEAAEDLAAQIYIAGGSYADFRAEVGRVQSGTVDMTEAIWDAAAAHNVLERATQTGTNWDRNFRESIINTSSTLQDYVVDLSTASGRLEYATVVYRDAEANAGAYEVTADRVAAAEQRRADAHDAAVEASELAAEAARILNIESGKLFQGFLDNEPITDDISGAIWRVAQNSDLGAESLAVMASVFGDYSDEAVEAALKSALIEQKIQDLVTEFGDGERGIESIRAELNRFISDLDGIPDTISTTISVDYNIPPWPGIPGMPGGTGTGVGSPVATPMAAGGRVRGGIPGRDSVPAMLMPDEIVIPASHSNDMASAQEFLSRHIKGGDTSTVTIEQGAIVINAAPGMSEQAIAQNVLSEINRQLGQQANAQMRI